MPRLEPTVISSAIHDACDKRIAELVEISERKTQELVSLSIKIAALEREVAMMKRQREIENECKTSGGS